MKEAIMMLKKLVGLCLACCISFSFAGVSVQAKEILQTKVTPKQAIQSSSSLAKKLQISESKLAHLAPKMIAQLHHDFDNVDVIGIKKTYYALDKSKNQAKQNVVTVSETQFENLSSNSSGVSLDATGSRIFTGVGTLTSYILSDNSLAMSFDLLDSFYTGSSGSFDAVLTLNNSKGTMGSGTTFYSRDRYHGPVTDQGTIDGGFDYKTTKYTVPQLITETNRYFYLSCYCDGNTSGQVLKTDFAVCNYTLGFGNSLPNDFYDFINHFFVSSETTHYSDGARS